MLEIIIIVLDTETNTRLLILILGLPVFCKFNFIFFEDHSNMLKILSLFPLCEYIVTLEKIFSPGLSTEVSPPTTTHTKKVDRNVYSTISV